MKPSEKTANPPNPKPDQPYYQDVADSIYPEGQKDVAGAKNGEPLSLMSESLAPTIEIHPLVLITGRRFRCRTRCVAFNRVVWCRLRCWHIRDHPIHPLPFQATLWTVGSVHFLLRSDIQHVRES